MALLPAPLESNVDVDKISYEIFSILESKFLFGYDDHPELLLSSSSAATDVLQPPPFAGAGGRVRILSIDGAGRPSDALLAAASLARLESSLRRHSGNPSARVADFFDVAAGSGAGGVLAALLFTRGTDGRPLHSADEALQLLLARSDRSSSSLSFFPARRGPLGWVLPRGRGAVLRRVFGDATLRDTLKPVLVPCYDLATGAPFLFSRADAVEADGFDFRIRDVCAATCTDPAVRAAPVTMRSADGRTRIAAVGGGVVMGNPAVAAITHVLNNKPEFPFASGMEDLLVLSLGATGDGVGTDIKAGMRRPVPSQGGFVRIAGEGLADVVDQAVAMAFGHSRTNNYVRIQNNGFQFGDNINSNTKNKLLDLLEKQLSQKNVESLLFRGKKISEQTNAEKLECFAGELVKEDERRKKSLIPNVVLKQAMVPPPATSSKAAPARTLVTSLSC